MREITRSALPPTSPPVPPRKVGRTKTLTRNYSTRKKIIPSISINNLLFIKLPSIVTAESRITTRTVTRLLIISALNITFANCRSCNFKLLKVPTTTAADDTDSTLFRKTEPTAFYFSRHFITQFTSNTSTILAAVATKVAEFIPTSPPKSNLRLRVKSRNIIFTLV